MRHHLIQRHHPTQSPQLNQPRQKTTSAPRHGVLIRPHLYTLLIFVLFGGIGVNIAHSAPRSPETIQFLAQADQVSEREAADIAKDNAEDKILLIERVDLDGVPGYRVKILKRNGRVKSVFVNAQNGRRMSLGKRR
ncbi:MAG: PepSY domain-containing protein [Pseudomonadales bacterium]|nr:PepSY domain-containing protein [Pseudomonadales bacterium]